MMEAGIPAAQRAPRRPAGLGRAALVMAELIYHTAVREVRKGHRNAAVGLFITILQTVILIAFFYFLLTVVGTRNQGLRGDFLLYIMSGILLFMTHTKAVSAVTRADGPTSAMMQHAPLNTTVTMAAAALASLYLQMLSIIVILFLYHVIWTPVVVDQWMGALGMLLIAWISGVGVGVCLAALRPWFPDGVVIATSIYNRASMITSGKMFVANKLPGSVLVFFDWNPLFHAIDQARGFVFLNYNPHFSAWPYALWVTAVLLVVGMMGESYTRRHASLSWSAGK